MRIFLGAARYPDFALGNFPLPDLGWQPPHPYTHADIMIDGEEERAFNREGE